MEEEVALVLTFHIALYLDCKYQTFFLDLLRIYLLKYDTVKSLLRNNQFLQYFEI